MQNTSLAALLLDWCFCYGIFSIHLLPISCQSLPLMREVAAQKADGGRDASLFSPPVSARHAPTDSPLVRGGLCYAAARLADLHAYASLVRGSLGRFGDDTGYKNPTYEQTIGRGNCFTKPSLRRAFLMARKIAGVRRPILRRRQAAAWGWRAPVRRHGGQRCGIFSGGG